MNRTTQEIDADEARYTQELTAANAKIQELEQRLAALSASDSEDPLGRAADQARALYLDSLPALYASERAAGLPGRPAPGDPTAPKNAFAKGTRTKMEARILSVKPVPGPAGGTTVVFARGPGADPAAWKEEAVALMEGSCPLRAGDLAALEVSFAPGQDPPWRILGVASRR
ncbi:MAG: hypothetical protein HYZ53_00230 [Planctomycetes bacterium]|nr:hypothetical protein [Planctomycetota bacterium]